MKRATSNAVCWLVVVGLHAVFIIVIRNQAMKESRPAPSAQEPVSVMFFIQQPKQIHAPPAHRNVRIAPLVTNVQDRKIEAPLSEAPVDIPPIDWRDQATKAAAVVAKRLTDGEAHDPMSNKSRSAYAEDPSAKNELFAQPLRRNGDSVRTNEGEALTWLNDKCYATTRDFGPPRLDANSMVVVCKGNVGKRPADGTLFDHLKPQYLRRAEDLREQSDKTDHLP